MVVLEILELLELSVPLVAMVRHHACSVCCSGLRCRIAPSLA